MNAAITINIIIGVIIAETIPLFEVYEVAPNLFNVELVEVEVKVDFFIISFWLLLFMHSDEEQQWDTLGKEVKVYSSLLQNTYYLDIEESHLPELIVKFVYMFLLDSFQVRYLFYVPNFHEIF